MNLTSCSKFIFNYQILHKMNHYKLVLLWSLTILSYSAFAQKTSLLFSKSMLNKTGKTIEIELTDSMGNSQINADFFNKSDLIFFKVKPIPGQNWNFSKSDAEKKLALLKLVQDKNILSVKRLKNTLEKDAIKEVIITYNKSSMNVLKPFLFRFDEADSELITIPETLWPNYKVYSEIINKSKIQLEENNNIGSFRTITKLWSVDPNFSKFTFYQTSLEFLNQIIEKNIAQSNESLQKCVSNFQKNPTEKSLDQLFSLKDTLIANLNDIQSFLKGTHEGIDPVNYVKATENLKSKVLNDVTESNRLFKKSMLSLFEKKNYADYKFKLYTELLARLLVSVDKIKPINGLGNLYISNIKKYPSLKSELIDMGWNDDFSVVCRLLNDNIHEHTYLFNDTVINNYAINKAGEAQPYYDLFKAYNRLIKKEKEQFVTQINQCLTTVTDREMLSDLDLSISLANMDSISNDTFWDVVQKGYDAQTIGAFQEAKKYYEKAEKLSVSNDVLCFLMGENSYKLNDRYSSEIYFNRALAINPKFIMPKLFRIEFLIDDKDYETAIGLVNEALDTNPIWYFYLKKAILLQLLGKNENAKSILVNNCIALNSLNYDQYIVLGDIYLALNDVKSARENFMIAGNIKPNDKQYKKRMELLKQIPEKPTETGSPVSQ